MVNNELIRVMRDIFIFIDFVIVSRVGFIRNIRNLELGISDYMLVYVCI